MKDLRISCVIYPSTSIGPERVRAFAACAIRRGFEFKRVTEDDKLVVVRTEAALPELFDAHSTTSKTKKGEEAWDVAFPAHTAEFPDLIGDFEFYQFNPHQSRLALSGLIDFELEDQRKHVKSCEELWSNVAHDLYTMAPVDYGYVDNTNRNSTQRKDVEKRRLPVIGWLNFRGLPYVEKYGRKTLLGMPGMTTRELPDGGVFHQLSPRLVTSDRKFSEDLRTRVTEYCAEHGLKAKCFAPYLLQET
jgi:hypothetical protein